jgi:hypothetical protein
MMLLIASIPSRELPIQDPSLVTAAETRDQRPSRPSHDVVADGQGSRSVPIVRPEQRMTEHDRSGIFEGQKVRPSSAVFENQLKEGKTQGFHFYRDPLE